MLGFRRATVLESPDSVRRVAATGWLVGATKPTGRPCRQRTLRCSQGSQGWKLKLVRQGPERWQWSGRELSRPKSLDIRRPIQGMVGRRDQANRATVPPAHIAMLTRLTRMEAKTRPARSGAMAVVRSRAISA